jgi:hypothetical protein
MRCRILTLVFATLLTLSSLASGQDRQHSRRGRAEIRVYEAN